MTRILRDEIMRKAWLGSFLLPALLAGCQSNSASDLPPDVSETLQTVGRRLSQSVSEAKLTALATRGPALLAMLTRAERDALGRDLLRFHCRKSIVVEIAAPTSSVPFWISDQGFAATGLSLENADAQWSLFRKSFAPGWVGLGVNGLDRSAPAHYVVFLRSADGQPPLRTEDVKLREPDAGGWSIVPTRPDVSAAREVHRPFLAIPHELEGTLLLQPFHDRRHASLLATGRVWKTHVPSGTVPDQVAIAFGSDPAHEMVWTWRTAPSVEQTAVRIIPARFESAESGPNSQPDLKGARLIRGHSTLVRSPSVLNDPVIRRHEVTVEGLSPDTVYLYSLGDGSDKGWGSLRAVKTGRPLADRTEFLYMGDPQTGLKEWGQRLTAAFRRHPAIDFIVLAGDLVDRGNERTNWDHFFLRSEEIFGRIPVMPCVGNHEYLDRGPRLYQAYFHLPRNGPAQVEPGLVYHFETGGALIAVLDSTLAVSSTREARRQADWLDAVLTGSRADWKFVLFHHPIYPSHPSRDNPTLREHWAPILDKHHVDMVLQGHDHAYLRTYPMRGDRPASGPDQGTIYVVSVSGDKFCDQVPRHYTEFGLTQTSTYQTIEIDNVRNRLTYRAWNDAGEVIDRVIITKPGHTRQDVAQRRALNAH
jgi:3',5'-cyclic AMP phosphodiesterase CpdA